MKTRWMRSGLCAAWLLGLAGCAADVSMEDEEGAPVVAAEQELLAELDIEGGKARFVAVSDELWVFTETVGRPTPLSDPTLRGLNAAEIYESWSGRQAPTALSERVLQMWPEGLELSDAPGAHEVAAGPVASSASALSNVDFANQFCGGMQFCWLDRTGTWEREQQARYWLGWVDSVRGDMTVQMRRWEIFGGWTSVWVRDVPSGTVLGALGATSDALNKRPLKFKIFNADGDHWHLAAHWQ